ncbi:DUF2752 domain-containing protein [Carboxylicivirga sediminis]|uniref:DUF2752 domain-containing protein n=1 Tax=Carboxylicivirga sediminis TaxID=2006564 RepID=A0A941IXQ4_9BACT|nr:DUF2752 domain-containing protein [Carboxylicivirga sediminis]MBR8536280.1 DUF2752 domain-containing protein [Carboxylicivirga sediminis]
MKRVTYKYRNSHLEAYFWLIALVSLAFSSPDKATHYTLCIFKNLGFDFCPGCGLGHGIAYLFHGQLLESWQAHPLALLAVVILLVRSINILRKDIKFTIKE